MPGLLLLSPVTSYVFWELGGGATCLFGTLICFAGPDMDLALLHSKLSLGEDLSQISGHVTDSGGGLNHFVATAIAKSGTKITLDLGRNECQSSFELHSCHQPWRDVIQTSWCMIRGSQRLIYVGIAIKSTHHEPRQFQ